MTSKTKNTSHPAKDGKQGEAAANRKAHLAQRQDQQARPREGSKLATLVDLLSRSEGATIEEMAAATGWQSHSVRGAMSGSLTKVRGFKITSEQVDSRGRVYHIANPVLTSAGEASDKK